MFNPFSGISRAIVSALASMSTLSKGDTLNKPRFQIQIDESKTIGNVQTRSGYNCKGARASRKKRGY